MNILEYGKDGFYMIYISSDVTCIFLTNNYIIFELLNLHNRDPYQSNRNYGTCGQF